MNQRDIDLIISLHKHLNLTKTSKELYISQPALTKRIFRLEEMFDTQLIIRHSKGVLFTSQGEILYQHCKQISKQFQALEDSLKTSQGEITGTLRLGVSNIYAHYQLPQILKEFSTMYPLVNFEIHADRSTRVFELLRNNEVSLAIIRGSFAWQSKKLKIDEENVCIASATQIDLNTLHKAGYIKYVTEPSFQAQINTWLNENLEDLPMLTASASSIDTCLGLVKSGLGWSIVANIGLNNFDGYQLNLTNSDGTPFTRSTYLYYHEESVHLRHVKAFIDFIEEYTK